MAKPNQKRGAPNPGSRQNSGVRQPTGSTPVLLTDDQKQAAILHCPLAGTLFEWDSGRRFGFFRPIGSSRTKFWAHISASIRPLMKDEQITGEQACIAAIAVDARRYKERGDSRPAAIRWALMKDIGVEKASYQKERLRILAIISAKRLVSLLEAKWFCSQWGGTIRYGMQDDALLCEACKRAADLIGNSPSEFIQLLNAITRSPQAFCQPDKEQWIAREVCKNLKVGLTIAPPIAWDLLQQAGEHWRPMLEDIITGAVAPPEANDQQPAVINVLSALCPSNRKKVCQRFFEAGVNFAYSEELLSYLRDDQVREMFCRNAVGLDLESNGNAVFQIACHDGVRPLSTPLQPEGMTPDDFMAMCDGLAAQYPDRWIVGHNVLAWDLPVIQRLAPGTSWASQKTGIWDTQLISWYLEPWRRSHALTGAAKAHDAAEDALAALKLFRQQAGSLPLDYRKLLNDRKWDMSTLWASKSGLKARGAFRAPPNWLKKFNQDKTVNSRILVPLHRLREVEWVPGVAYAWPQGYADPLDRELSGKKLREIASNHTADHHFQLLVAVVTEAESAGVRVRLRMVPLWLREGREDHVFACADWADGLDDRPSSRWVISTYEALATSNDEMRNEWLSGCGHPFPEFSRLGMLRRRNEFSDSRIADILENDAGQVQGGFLQRISSSQALEKMLGGKSSDQSSYWLEHLPVRESRSRLWHLWEIPDAVSRIDGREDNEEQPDPFDGWHCEVPLYLDEETGAAAAGDSLWPTSSSRYDYWRDTVKRLRSLLFPLPDDVVVAFLTRHAEEREALACALSSVYDVPDLAANPLEQLRRARSNKRRVIIAGADKAVHLSECADLVAVPLLLVLEELPFFQWWMAERGYSPHAAENDSDAGDEDDEQNDSTADNLLSKDDPEVGDEGGGDFQCRENLSVETMQAALRRYLPVWGQTFLGFNRVVLLDPRLDMMSLRDTGFIKRLEVPLAEMPADMIAALESVRDRLGSVQRQDPPKSLEEYTDFLVTHWNRDKKQGDSRISGFYDFQEPIIQALAQSPNDDILVRLPTGAGKSVLFQVPALSHGLRTQRLSVVLSPLRALMKDQVVRLWQLGFFQSVDYLSGDREAWENAEVLQGIIDHRIKLLYVAPERFRNGRFRDALLRRGQSDQGLEFAIIDEAHCVSQWGYEFRPDYFYAAGEICRNFRSNGMMSRVMLFSATVTSVVNQDLEHVFIPPDMGRRLVARPVEYSHPVQDHIRIQTIEVPQGLYASKNETRLTSRGGEIVNTIREANPRSSVVIVFVTRKRHAEKLCGYLQDELPSGFNVACFHAGLPSNVRASVYDHIKKGEVNVLVATKAFGMGMDIPNIHWCVHVAPPGFIEDYLQEVGRTGRDKKQRESVRGPGGKVECTLLYHLDDLAKNASLTRDSMVMPLDLDATWKAIMARVIITNSGSRICVLPSYAVEEVKGDKLRRALCWLERDPCCRITILGFLPNILRVSDISRKVLEQIQPGNTLGAVVAGALLKLFNTSEPAELQGKPPSDRPPTGRGFWSVVTNLVGFFFPTSAPANVGQPVMPVQNVEPTHIDSGGAELNMGAILRASGLDSIDDVYRGLFELQRNNCLKIQRTLRFKVGDNLIHAGTLWRWLGEITDLIVRKAESPREIDFEELVQSETMEENGERSPRENREWKTRQMVCARAAIRLCNAAGMRIREKLHDGKHLVYQYTLPGDYVVRTRRRIERLVNLAKSFVATIGRSGSYEMQLAEVIQLMGGKGVMRDATQMLLLVNGLDLYSCDEPLVPFSHILRIDVDESLVGPQEPGCRDGDQAMFKELERVNRLTELRSFAMRGFTGFTDERLRRKFIDEYFLASSPEEMLSLLDRTGTELGDGTLCEVIRREAIEAEIKKLRDGEEPQQFAACSAPWDRNILVNAGPGAGKTYVLMMRAAHLIHEQGLPPKSVLILAFNRAVVHEIRRRINKLFERLGLGGYASRLQIHTFHAFSLRCLPRIPGDSLNEHFSKFVDKCVNDPAFCKGEVVGGLRAVLVDEFQDMDDDRMKLLRVMTQAAQAGIMVIGDDDQDILRWNRSNKTEGAEHFQSFRSDYANPLNVVLKKNFRSGQRIVEHTQWFLTEHMPRQSHRELADVELSHVAAKAGLGEVCTDLDPARLEEEIERFRNMEGIKTIAILSRTNSDAAFIYERMLKQFPGTVLQGGDNLPIRFLRHVACWIDVCRNYLNTNGNAPLTEELRKVLSQSYRQCQIPEINPDGRTRGYVYNSFLWDTLLEDDSSATLQDHLDQLMDVDLESYGRLMFKTDIVTWVAKRDEMWGGAHRIVVSTIHKVKGLEFDVVIIIPSTSSFRPSLDGGYKDIADEVRLLYVGMTRAKSHLLYSLGPREQAWIANEAYVGQGGAAMMVGSLEEVQIGFPALARLDSQSYIQKNVAAGDKVRVRRTQAGGSLILHGDGGKPIAMLRNEMNGHINYETAELCVHSIVRHEINDDEVFNVGDMLPAVQARGWYYTVTFEGKIR